MISAGIIGTARHGMKPYKASNSLVKTLTPRPPPRRYFGPRPRHVGSIDGIADHFEREIGLYARAQIEVAALEQRPAAVRAFASAADRLRFAFHFGVDRLAEKMAEQDIFARDGGVGLELEAPLAIRALAIEQRLRRRRNTLIEILPIRRRHTLFPIMTTSAARLPDRTALSDVAGNPVAVQSRRERDRPKASAPRDAWRFLPGWQRRSPAARGRSATAAAPVAIPVARDTSRQTV